MNAERIDVALSPADTRRFGIRVCRCRVDHGTTDALAEAIRQSQADVTIVRSEASGSGFVKDLARSGFQVVHAGVLVYYRTDLREFHDKQIRRSATDIRVATGADAAALGLIAGKAFSGFRGHYSASPVFAPADVLEGYREWARNCVADGQHEVLVAESGQDVVGFLAYKVDADHSGAEIVLNAVMPALFNRGIYTDLLRATMRRLAGDRCGDLRVSTQVHNYPVQKVWARAGFHLYLALDTFHVTRGG